MSNKIIELYDEEEKRIDTVLRGIRDKYINMPLDDQMIIALDFDIEERFRKIGFVAKLNYERLIGSIIAYEEGTGPINPVISVDIVERIDPVGEFDYDKKRYEVNKERNG